jgi:hypothetical protein
MFDLLSPLINCLHESAERERRREIRVYDRAEREGVEDYEIDEFFEETSNSEEESG